MQRTAGVFAASHVEGQIVEKVLEGVAEVVSRTFGHQLLSQFTLHIESIGDAVACDLDVELHFLALGGLDVVLLDFNLIGEGLLKMLFIVDDALSRLHGKRGEEHHQGN